VLAFTAVLLVRRGRLVDTFRLVTLLISTTRNSFWIKHADADGWVDSKRSRKRDDTRERRESFFAKEKKGDFFPRHQRVDLLEADPYQHPAHDFGPDDDGYDDDDEEEAGPSAAPQRTANRQQRPADGEEAPSASQRTRRGEGSLSEPDYDDDEDDDGEDVTKGATFAPQSTTGQRGVLPEPDDEEEEEDELYGAFERPEQVPPRPPSSSTRVSHSKFL
jgi:hypothetical protein